MGDWEEIRRLAADFQRAQLSGTVHKLSERNCVELVAKLIELKLIDVIFTNDGKEYLTHQQLGKEIKDELWVCGGRVGLVELASTLNVDYSQVEAAAQNLCKGDRELHLVLGQLLSGRYLENLCVQINEKLQQTGTLAIPSLTKVYDLPADFLVEQVHDRLGSIIEGFKDETDPKVLLTTSHVARNRARIRGVLSAITVPTTVSSIISRFGFQEKLFFSLAEELIRTGRLPGIISGGRSAGKASYIPHSYARAQTAWVDSFYASNGYLEYEAVARLGISEPLSFVKKKFGTNTEVLYLGSCCVGQSIVEQMEAAIEEALTSGGWCDVSHQIPSVLTSEDAGQMILSSLKSKPSAVLIGDSVVVSQSLLHKIVQAQEAEMEERAVKDVESGAVAQMMVEQGAGEVKEEVKDKKEERRKKAAAGSAGGGAQGRQTKTKSTKKKGGKRRDDDDWSDDNGEVNKKSGSKASNKNKPTKELEFKTARQLEESLKDSSVLTDFPEEMFEEVSDLLIEQLNRKYKEIARDKFHASLANSLLNKKRTHGDLTDKINTQYTTIRLGEKAVADFTRDEHKAAIGKHLLKTLCTEIVNEMFQFVAEENMIKVDQDKELTTEARVKIINELPKEISESGLKIHKSLAGSSVTEFLTVLESHLVVFCDVMLKKQDKKKDRQILFGHRQSLLEQLGSCSDPALTLHLAVLCIFYHVHGSMLHASGKFVPMIVEHLGSRTESLSSEQISQLEEQQKLVIASLNKNQVEETLREISSKLELSTANIKKLVTSFKKSSPND